jgi:hypothetical protein
MDPATKLSQVVVSAITELFTEGLGDPRGCEYRMLPGTYNLKVEDRSDEFAPVQISRRLKLK